MSDAATDCVTACGLCIYAAFSTWCNLHAFGADVRCCGGQRGCCGSCCDSSFNEDDFDERMRRVQARQGDSAQIVEPAPSQGMHVSNDAKPTTIAES